MSRVLRNVAIYAVLCVGPIALLRLPEAREGLAALVDLVRSSGPAGVLLYAGVYAAGAVVATPFSILSAIGGFTFGFGGGLMVAALAGTAAATVAFEVGRLMGRRFGGDGAGRAPRTAAVLRAVDRHGLRIALLLRLSPLIPQSMLSYLLSISRLRRRDFALATLLGLLPVHVFYVYVGSLVKDASALLEAPQGGLGPWRWAFAAAGLLLTAVTITLTARLARRELAKALEPEPAQPLPAAAGE
ncbi:VTT domain-containing protein [Myxococcota bacterium]|nr:VTT domain-containing protein [Myxococcota bacterium]